MEGGGTPERQPTTRISETGRVEPSATGVMGITIVDKVRHFDNNLRWFNPLLVLGVVTVPFPTALVAGARR